MGWKITSLKLQLKEIHPSATHIELTSDTIFMHFEDGSKMEPSEFVWGTQTRKALEELETLLRENNDCHYRY